MQLGIVSLLAFLFAHLIGVDDDILSMGTFPSVLLNYGCQGLYSREQILYREQSRISNPSILQRKERCSSLPRRPLQKQSRNDSRRQG